MANRHDVGYKELFSYPQLVKELILSFVHEDFVNELDFSTLERLDKSFITTEFRQKESDLIYRINFRDKAIYIFLLIEFQSTVDKFMALRILRYITEFYEFLVKKEKNDPLPPVFPILLYNGDQKWTAAANIQQLISASIPGKYIPSFQYYKIIENELPKSILLQIKNVVSAIFYVENCQFEEIQQEIEKLIGLIKTEAPEIVQLFSRWINHFFNKISEAEKLPVIQEIKSLKEVVPMFASSVKKYGEKILQQGIEQGEILNKQKILIKQLTKKFGLTEQEKDLILTVNDTVKLDTALEEFVFAQTKEQVLDCL